MFVTDKLRLRDSVGIVCSDGKIEFFKGNTRESITIEMNFPNILDFLSYFNGENSIEYILNKNPELEVNELINFLEFLNINNILIIQDGYYSNYSKYYRLINCLEDYFQSVSDVILAIKKLKQSKVMILGLGSVGSIIAKDLVQLGVSNLILVDNDNVDISNLHRQAYFENDISKLKSYCLCESLYGIDENLNLQVINKRLSDDFFESTSKFIDVNLIINCTDEPSVDLTSYIVSSFAMKHNIPHIVGGGYNLHLTLIGQTIIPYQTACFNCFKRFLTNINNKELENVRKLHRENRKLGSFSPLSGIAANLASLDAFKILIGRLDMLNQANKRIEFDMRSLKFKSMNVPKYDDCEWCGNGKK